MFPRRWFTFPGILLRRRVIAGLALVSYLLAAVGIPIPVLANAPQPFVESCHGRLCGCSIVEQRRHQCCCCSPSTPQERTAELGTSPTEANAAKGCCAADPGSETSPLPKPPSSKVVWIRGISARQCSGQATLWVNIHPAPVPLPWTDWNFDSASAGEVRPLDSLAVRASQTPPVPPPRPCL